MTKKSLPVFVAALLSFSISFLHLYRLSFYDEAAVNPAPIGDDDEEFEKMREKWWEMMHVSAPGTDWQSIEASNKLQLFAERAARRTSYSRSTAESFANGKLQGTWSERGSSTQAGSMRAVDYLPEQNTIYTISAGGDLWKCPLTGNNWTLVNDAITFTDNLLKVFVKQSGGQRILALTNNSSLIYSDNDGASFSTCTSTFPISLISSMTVLNDAGRTIYCLAKGVDSSGANSKIVLYRSTNSGTSFTLIKSFQGNDEKSFSLCNPYNTNEVYVLDNQSSGTNLRFWTVTGATVSLTNEYAIPEVNEHCILKGQNNGTGTTFYAMVKNTKVYRSINSGASWTFKSTLPVFAWDEFDVSNNSPDAVFFGKVNAYRSVDQGATWTVTNQWYDYYTSPATKIHADIMEMMQFKKTDGTPFMLINNDGGVSVSYDNLSTSANLSLSSLNSGQYYDVLTDPLNPDRVFAGSQDQGFQRNLSATSPGVLNLNQVLSGDYGYLCLSNNSNHLWTEYPGGTVYYYDSPIGNYTTVYYTQGTQKPNNGWMLPMASVPDATENSVLMGGGNVTNGGGSYLSKLTATGSSVTASQFSYDFRANSNTGTAGITAIECSRKNLNKIYVATEDGSFFYTNDKGLTWAKATFSGPRPWYLYGSSIYSSRIDANTVWFAGTGYSNAPVYKSLDGGQTFTSISTGMPNTLVHEITANDNESMLFAATDAGPYVYVVSDNRWYSLTGASTPIQVYTSVEYIPSLSTVRFGTYGRGIWDLKITTSFIATNFYWRNDQNPVSGQWNVSNYWWNGAAAQLPAGTEILNIDGNVGTTMNNDLTTTNRFQILFGNGNTPAARTINGTTVNTFNDLSGTWPRIQNSAQGITHTINFPITIGNAATYGLELVPIAGGLVFGGPINNNGQAIYVYGNNSTVNASDNYVRFNNTISGSGALNISQQAVAKINAAQSYTGQTQIDKGEVWVESNGNISSSNIMVGNTGQMANTAKLWLADAAGGTTLSANITVNQGNPNTRYVGGRNTSGTNTYSGSIINNGSYVNYSALNSGGTTAFTGVISGSAPLTVEGAGTVSFAGANTYTGKTTISNGAKLQVESGGRIGNGTNNIVQLAANGQLILHTNATVAMVKENATGDGGTINLNANTLTLSGLTGTSLQNSITGAGNIIKQGAGSLSLYGTQSYSGTTTVSGGDITSSVNLSSSLITVKSGASFSLNPGNNININSLTLESGATLNIPASTTLTISGTLTVQPGANINYNSSGQINYGSNSKLVIAGTGNYTTFDALYPAGNSPAHFEVAVTGTVNLHATRTVSDTLKLTSGTLTTGGYQINIANGGTVVRTAGHVAGNLQKYIPAGNSVTTFEVGAATGYRPVTISFNNVTVAGNVAASVTQTTGAHSQLVSSQISATKRVDRYFTLTNNGLTLSDYSATFNYLSADVLNSASTSSFIIGKYTAAGWSYSQTGTKTSTSTQITGVTGFGDFAIGEFSCNVSATASNNGPVCPSSSLTLNAVANNGSGNYIYNWTGPNSFTSTQQSPVISNTVFASGGTYTITVTDQLNNCTATANTIVAISGTVVPAVSIAVLTGNNPTCPGTPVTFKATPSGGGSPSYQWKKNGSNVGTNSSTYTDAGNTTGSITVVMTSSLTCASVPTATSNSINLTIGGNRWLGGTGDWNTASNWCAGLVPSLIDNVVIPAGATPYPALSADATINAIDLQTGATVSLNGHKLILNGAVTGTGSFTGSYNSDLTIGGAAGTLSFTAGTGLLRHLLLAAGSSATLGTPLKISGIGNGTVTVNSGATLNTADNLIIGSDINGTASVANSAGTIAGDVTVERFIPKNTYKSWRLLSVPVNGTQTINQAWQEGQSPAVNGNPGYGTIITGTTGSSGFDYLASKSSMLTFNSATTAWENIPSTNQGIATNSGYMLYVRGDRSVAPSSSILGINSTTLRTKGPLYQGSLTPVTIPAGNINTVVGNQYASAIDFDLMIKSGLSSFKIWDPKLLGTYNLGGYQTFSAINDYDPIPGGGSYGSLANSRIESGQAFIVSSSSGGSITLTEAAKTSGSRNVFRSSNIVSQLKTSLLSSSTSGYSLTDGNAVVFNNSYAQTIDDNDVVKMKNTTENISLYHSGQELSLEARPDLTESDTILFRMSNLKEQQYKLQFVPVNIEAANLNAFIEDKYNGTRMPVSLSDTSYISFTVTSKPASSSSDRFRIIFTRGSALPVVFTSIKAYQKGNDVIIDWKTGDVKGLKQYEVEHSIDGVSFNRIGTKAADDSHNYSVTHRAPIEGNNYYRIRSRDVGGLSKITNVVRVKMEGKGSITVYPNPVVDGKISLKFNNKTEGKYVVRLINKAGQILTTSTISHVESSGSYIVPVSGSIAGGIYQIEVSPEKGNKVLKSVIIKR